MRRHYLMVLWSTLCLLIGTSRAAADEPAVAPRPRPEQPIELLVDRWIDARLAEEGVEPAARIDDANLIRRLTLDLAGRIPAVPEVRAFLESAASDKRQKLVDRLLDSPEFIEHQATMFDAFICDEDGGIREYLLAAFREERGWDRMFRDILIGRYDDPLEKQALDFLEQRAKDTDRLTNDVSVVFFGINVSFAKCHDHPLVPDWTQDHFYGMQSFFNRTFENGGFVGEREYGRVSFKTTAGESRDAKLMFLTSTVLDEPASDEPSNDQRKEERELLKKLAKDKQPPPAPQYSRRQRLVEVVLEAGQDDFFARAIVNRVWHQLFGYGLVMPLDQLHESNPSSHPELLDELARDLRRHGYNLKRLMRGLVLSQAYSRSSRWPASGDPASEAPERPDEDLFAVAQVRPLTPEQLARSMSLAAADPDAIAGGPSSDELHKRIREAARADNADLFDRPRENFQISADEALLFTNGEKIAENYLNGGLVRRLVEMSDDRELLRAAVWAVLGRPPDDDESSLLGGYLADRSDRREQAVRQIVWSLLTSSEFRFNY